MGKNYLVLWIINDNMSKFTIDVSFIATRSASN